MDRPQGSRQDLASLDEPLVEFCLDTLMPPLLLAELRYLDQSCDLTVEYSTIRPTGARVKIPLYIGTLGSAKAVLGLGSVDQELLRGNEYLVVTDFVSAEIWTTAGLGTYYVVFFTDLASRKVHVARTTPHRPVRWTCPPPRPQIV